MTWVNRSLAHEYWPGAGTGGLGGVRARMCGAYGVVNRRDVGYGIRRRRAQAGQTHRPPGCVARVGSNLRNDSAGGGDLEGRGDDDVTEGEVQG